MPQADAGYVGGAPAKINLYVGKECVVLQCILCRWLPLGGHHVGKGRSAIAVSVERLKGLDYDSLIHSRFK